MPIYEFKCEACGTRFEALVPMNTTSRACPACESERTTRLLSTPGAPMKLVKSPGAARQQEARNAKLHAHTKERFKKAVGKIHEAKRRGTGGSGPA
ncbi:MAG: zinc ribbon domain-containing protein [Actinomycetota bacterium]|nr:zinc ribbon domain-containing protein [Actinomycetota bacterium]